jgi:hypothetical protein
MWRDDEAGDRRDLAVISQHRVTAGSTDRLDQRREDPGTKNVHTTCALLCLTFCSSCPWKRKYRTGLTLGVDWSGVTVTMSLGSFLLKSQCGVCQEAVQPTSIYLAWCASTGIDIVALDILLSWLREQDKTRCYFTLYMMSYD